MAKLSDFREPEDPKAREALRRREPPFTLFGQLDDASAEERLREILQLRRVALRESHSEADLAFDLVRQKASKLIEGIAGWAFYGSTMAAMAAGELYPGLPSRMRRNAICSTLSRIPLLPAPQREEIARALEALEWGQVDDILVLHPKKQRRKIPLDTAEAQLDLLMWIRWQFGRGRLEYEARGEVAEAVGLSPAAIQKWRLSAKKSFDNVDELMDRAKAIGRADRIGVQADEQPIDQYVIGRLHLMSMQAMADRWKKARSPHYGST